MAKFYKVIQRDYQDPNTNEWRYGRFVARGQWADGHLAYSRVDMAGEPLSEDDDCTYFQVRYGRKLVMFHI